MKQLVRLLFICIPFLFLACDYSPSGSHYEDVNPIPDVRGASITLHEQPDTFYVRGDVQLYFDIKIPSRHLYGYQLVLGNQIISQRHTNEIFFEQNHLLKSAHYRDGYHTFQILALAESKTGSLADKKGEEAVVLYRSWVVHIDNSPIVPTLITTIAPEDGQLKVEWEPYAGDGFDVFELRRNFGTRMHELVATFTDRSVTSWKDPQYIGGRVEYYIVRRHKTYTVASPPTMYEYYYPVVDYTYNKDNSISFAFRSTPFHRNFNGYKITSPEGHQSIQPGINDTLVTWEAPSFGAQYFHISVNPQSNHADGAPFSVGSTSAINGLGTAWGPTYAGLFLKRPAVDRFYTFNGVSIEVIDANTLQPLSRRTLNYYMSDFSTDMFMPIAENGQHLYVLSDDNLLKLNPSTLSTQETIRLENILPEGSTLWGHYRPQSLRVSNSNRILLCLYSISGVPSVAYVLDMNTRQVLAKFETEDDSTEPGISPDGKMITFDRKIYIESSPGKWQKQQITIPEFEKVQFHPTRSQFMLKQGKSISFYSTLTGALEKTLHLEENMVVYDVDGGSGHLYGLGKEFYIYNLSTGQLSRKIKVANPGNNFSTSNFFVFKDRLFSRTRYLQL